MNREYLNKRAIIHEDLIKDSSDLVEETLELNPECILYVENMAKELNISTDAVYNAILAQFLISNQELPEGIDKSIDNVELEENLDKLLDSNKNYLVTNLSDLKKVVFVANKETVKNIKLIKRIENE